MPLPRSFLYVPANREKFLDKAMGLPADAFIFDLEDSVPVPEKENARAGVRLGIALGAERRPLPPVGVSRPPDGLIQKRNDGVVGVLNHHVAVADLNGLALDAVEQVLHPLLEGDGVDMTKLPRVHAHRQRMAERANVKRAIAEQTSEPALA